MSSLFYAFQAHTNWMSVILFFQMVSFVIMGEKIVSLYIKRKTDQREQVSQIIKKMMEGSVDQALMLCERLKHVPISKVCISALNEYKNNGTKESIQTKMDEILLKEATTVEKRTGLLATCANCATAMGLFGTIYALFHSVGAVNMQADEKAKILSDGFGLAIGMTIYGLVVAIPALVMYAVLQNRASQLTEDLNKASLDMFIKIGYHYKNK